MKIAFYKIALLFLLPAGALFLSGCDQGALTDSTTNGIPDTGGTDSTQTPFITFVSGSETGGPVGTIYRRNAAGPNFGLGIFGPSGAGSLNLNVEPNFAVKDTIEFEYSVSGSAVRGGDYNLTPSSPTTIEFDTATTSIDSRSLVASVLAPGEAGVTLTTETRTAEVTLESATTVNETRQIKVGRGGSDVGVSRTFNVSPSITLTNSAAVPQSSVSFDSTEVGGATRSILLVHNTSGIDFDLSNFSVTGADAGDFEIAATVPDNPVEPLSFAPQSPGPLPFNDFAQVAVDFAPGSSGEKAATLEFDVQNANDNTTATYDLSGVATSPGS